MKNVCYINAGAGAGKTFYLTSELTKCFVEEQIRPSEVILTTFTELAAGEFKEKARHAILNDKRLGKQPQRRMQLCVEMDSATIGTVHSIAFNFIKRFWYLLDYGADLQPMSQEYEKIYMNQSLTDMLSKEDFDCINAFSEHFVGKESEEDLYAWQKDLQEIVQKMSYYRVTNVKESLDKSVADVEAIFNGPEWTEDAVCRYQTLLKKIREQRQIDYETAMRTPAQRGAGKALDDVSCVDNSPDFPHNYKHYLALTKVINIGGGKTFQKTLSDKEKKLWTEFANYANSRSYLDEIVAYVKCLFGIAQRWKNNFEQYKKKNHIISFNDMELLFLRLLKEEVVKKEIRQRYKVLMVDEFQDSNPIQLEIFNILSDLISENGRSIWVGDAKQAIYGFRGTDTELVNGITQRFPVPNESKGIVKDEATGLSSGILNSSWRSREPLVTLVNQVFGNIFKQEIPYDNLIKLRPNFKDDLNDTAVRHWRITYKYKGKQNVNDGLAYKVEELIKSHLQVKPKDRSLPSHDVTFKDIAILANRNDDVEHIANSLRQRGIPVSITERNILQRKEIKLAMAFLEYFIEPSNKHLRANLAYLLNDRTTEELLKDRLNYKKNLGEDENDDWMGDAAFLQQLNQIKAHTERLSLSEIVTAVVYELNLPSLVGKWGEKQIRQQNLNSLIEMAQKYDTNCVTMGIGATLTGFLNFLCSNEVETEPDNTSDSVKVMTYHKSKGLEWPVVILTSLKTKVKETHNLIKRNYMGVHEWTKENSKGNLFKRQYLIHYFPLLFSNNANVQESVKEMIQKTEDFRLIEQRAVSERKRVLYVGMTRARDYLVSVGFIVETKDKKTEETLNWLSDVGIECNQVQQDLPESNLWGAPASKVMVEDLNMSDVPAPEVENELTYLHLEKPKEKSVYSPKYLLPSKLKIDDNDYTEITVIPENIGLGITRGNWKDMAAVGTCIHNIFAVYHPQHTDNEELAHQVINRAGLDKELGKVADTIVESAVQLYAYLTRTYGTATAIHQELPFYHEVDEQIIHGEMDLVWEYEIEGESHCVLVDYKTFLGKASELLEHTKQYVPQLRAYKSALTAGGKKVDATLIYYAVQGKIVAVHI